MKFLCPNCKAKYQISDEKIAGRTLKMDCRRCSHPIVIRGTSNSASPPASGGSPSSPPRGSRGSIASPNRRPGSHVGPAPSSRSSRSALGSDFRRQAASPPASQRPTALDQWHVAINDVPVGPMKRDEVAKKMASGAIHGDSLCWREGFDDWREVRKVPELAALMRHNAPRPVAPPPPPPKPAFPAPSRPLGRGGAASRPGRPPTGRVHAAAPARPQPVRPAAVAQSPASAPSNVVPIGGRLGAAAAPAFDEPVGDFVDDEEPTRVGSTFDFDALEAAAGAPAAPAKPPPEDEPVAAALAPAEEAFDPFASSAGAAPAPAPTPAPTPAPVEAVPAEAPERRRRAIPIGAWIAIAGAMAFGVALAVMVGTHFLTQPPAVATAPAPTPPPADPTPDPTPATPELEVPAEVEEPGGEEGETPADPDPEAEGSAQTGAGGSRRAGGGGRSTTTTVGSAGAGTGTTRPSGGESLTAAQREALARAGADTSAPAQISGARNPLLEGGGSRAAAAELTADQIRTVVNRNRSSVQQCYETEARRAGTAPTVRINAAVTIGASGTVTRVSSQGGSFGTLGNCIERAVRRWVFPRSSGPTSTSIPFVFSGQE